jgi:sugar lactone lactonase YvrE
LAAHASEVEIAFAARAATGESPTWCERERALYWIDIEEPALHRLDPASGRDASWEMPAEIGAFALCRSGGVIVALRTGLARIDLRSGGFSPLWPPPYNPLTHRFNDGACDAKGRFFVGVMHRPLASPNRQDPDGVVSRPLSVLSARVGLVESAARAVIGNGTAWSPDGRTFYFSDSQARIVWAWDFEQETATLSSKRVFARFGKDDGAPDGAAIDAEGHYWCALYGGSRIVRLSPEGKLVGEIRLPVSQPTMCAFGGEDYATLYITSAAHGLSEQSEPLAGCVFRCNPGVKGLPPGLFDDG